MELIIVLAIKDLLATEHIAVSISVLLIYIEIILECDWSISEELIPNKSAKICNKSTKCVTRNK